MAERETNKRTMSQPLTGAYQEQGENHREVIDVLQKQLEATMEMNKNLSAELDIHQTNVNTSQHNNYARPELQQQLCEIHMLRERLQESIDNNDRLRCLLEKRLLNLGVDADAVRAALSTEHTELRQQLDDLQECLTHRENAICDLKRQLDCAEQSLDQCRAHCSEVERSNNCYKREISYKNDLISELQTRVGQKEDYIQRLLTEADEKNGQVKCLQNENCRLVSELQRTQNRVAELQGLNKEMHCELTNLQQQEPKIGLKRRSLSQDARRPISSKRPRALIVPRDPLYGILGETYIDRYFARKYENLDKASCDDPRVPRYCYQYLCPDVTPQKVHIGKVIAASPKVLDENLEEKAGGEGGQGEDAKHAWSDQAVHKKEQEAAQGPSTSWVAPPPRFNCRPRPWTASVVSHLTKTLYVVGELDDFEHIKKYVEETRHIQEKIVALLQDRLKAYKKKNHTHSKEYGLARDLISGIHQIGTLDGEVLQLLAKFWLQDMAVGDDSKPVVDPTGKETIRKLQEELNNYQHRHKDLKHKLQSCDNKLHAVHKMYGDRDQDVWDKLQDVKQQTLASRNKLRPSTADDRRPRGSQDHGSPYPAQPSGRMLRPSSADDRRSRAFAHEYGRPRDEDAGVSRSARSKFGSNSPDGRSHRGLRNPSRDGRSRSRSVDGAHAARHRRAQSPEFTLSMAEASSDENMPGGSHRRNDLVPYEHRPSSRCPHPLHSYTLAPVMVAYEKRMRREMKKARRRSRSLSPHAGRRGWGNEEDSPSDDEFD